MKILISAAAVIVLLFLFVRFIEKKSLYYPLPTIEATPRDAGLKYDELLLQAEDGAMLSGWYIPSVSARATVLFSHGNAGNISHRLEKIWLLHSLRVNILIFDYRGYGMSTGSPSETGLYHDGQTFYDYLIQEKKMPPEKIVGYGESLGGAVVIDLAVRNKLGGVVLEGAFTSVRDMAGKYLPFVPSSVFQNSFDSLGKIKTMKAASLHFHSRSDEVVPFELGEALFAAAQGPKRLVELRGGHNDAFLLSHDLFRSELDAFISEL